MVAVLRGTIFVLAFLLVVKQSHHTSTKNNTQLNETRTKTDTKRLSIRDRFCNAQDGPNKYNMAAFVSLMVFIPVTIFGNVLVCGVILLSPVLLKQTTFMFLLSLAIADTLIGAVSMPLKAKMSWDNNFFCLPTFMCWFTILEETMLSLLSLSHLFVIAVDRYLSLKYVYQYNVIMTRKRISIAIVFTWIFAFVVCLLQIFKWEQPSGVSIEHQYEAICAIKNYNYFTTLYTLFFFLPTLVMLYAYVYIYKTAVRHIKEIARINVQDSRRTKEVRRKKQEFRTMISVIIVFIVFFICWFPCVIFYIVINYIEPEFWIRSREEMWFRTLYFVLVTFLPPLNSTTNPFIYVIINKQFRRSFMQIVLKLTGRNSPHIINNSSFISKTSFNGKSKSTIRHHTISSTNLVLPQIMVSNGEMCQSDGSTPCSEQANSTNFPNELFLLEHNYALPRLENVEDVEHAKRQRQHHLEIVRRRRANESLQQAQQRRAADALRQNARRAVENVADANARQHADAQRHRANRENELPQQAAVRRRADVLRHRVARAPRLLNFARINNVLPPTHSAGEFNIVCQHCGAIKFNNENHFKCCHNGKVALRAILQFPAEIRELLSNDSAQAKQFRKYIRVYNNAFSFASLLANIRPPPGRGPPCFRICGQLFHRYGALLPAQNELPNFSQLYIVEAAAALNMRIENPTHAHCNRETMQIIQDVLNRDSPYAAAYSNMAEVEREETARVAAENRQPSVVSMVMREGNDRRRYNAPLHQEVAAIFVGNNGAPPAARDIVVYPRNQPLRQIPYTSCNIDPMMYPILFPRGEPGWDPNMAHVREHATGVRNRLTQLEYYIYRIAIRREFSALHLAGKLFQQFLVDAYVKVEGQRLAFIRLNQNQLRAESYQGLLDYLQNATETRNAICKRWATEKACLLFLPEWDCDRLYTLLLFEGHRSIIKISQICSVKCETICKVFRGRMSEVKKSQIFIILLFNLCPVLSQSEDYNSRKIHQHSDLQTSTPFNNFTVPKQPVKPNYQNFCQKQHKPKDFNLIGFIYLMVLIPTTIVGNILVVIVVRMSPNLRKQTTYIFLSSLAVADALIGAITLVLKARITWDNGLFCLPTFMCWFTILVETMLSLSSVTHLFVIAIDRYFSLKYVYRYNVVMTRKRIFMVVAFVWIFSFLTAVLGIFKWDQPNKLSIKHQKEIVCGISNREYFTTVYVCSFIIPTILMVYMYTYIYRTALRHISEILKVEVHRTVSVKARQLKEKQTRTLRSVIIVFVVFITCWLPCITFTIITTYINVAYWKRMSKTKWVQIIYFIVTLTLPSFNSATNPFIYVISNKQFRSDFKRMIGRSKGSEEDSYIMATLGIKSLVVLSSNTPMDSQKQEKFPNRYIVRNGSEDFMFPSIDTENQTKKRFK
ncbi:uncharacterized protein LOC130612959 [Hydractinia symbiolongicarpus]|uniref:uncharacterized protein LOC130612959 n=1 Tax=Hydractinia symbiolongicarpus TaxID=13093 RepID=UPI00254ECA8F|nr:uncharacterized protein LOC130612959 [Hydractinia symbiolongicarpus]